MNYLKKQFLFLHPGIWCFLLGATLWITGMILFHPLPMKMVIPLKIGQTRIFSERLPFYLEKPLLLSQGNLSLSVVLEGEFLSLDLVLYRITSNQTRIRVWGGNLSKENKISPAFPVSLPTSGQYVLIGSGVLLHQTSSTDYLLVTIRYPYPLGIVATATMVYALDIGVLLRFLRPLGKILYLILHGVIQSLKPVKW